MQLEDIKAAARWLYIYVGERRYRQGNDAEVPETEEIERLATELLALSKPQQVALPEDLATLPLRYRIALAMRIQQAAILFVSQRTGDALKEDMAEATRLMAVWQPVASEGTNDPADVAEAPEDHVGKWTDDDQDMWTLRCCNIWPIIDALVARWQCTDCLTTWTRPTSDDSDDEAPDPDWVVRGDGGGRWVEAIYRTARKQNMGWFCQKALKSRSPDCSADPPVCVYELGSEDCTRCGEPEERK